MVETTRPDRRRSTRVLVRIALVISGADASGHPFQTSAETLLVNKHGARIRSSFRLKIGSEIDVVVEPTQKRERARVVWQGKEGSLHYGIELLNPGNFWAISF